MNVPKILEFLPFVRFILRHLKLSEISTVMLNDALEGLDMKVTMWCSFSLWDCLTVDRI